MEEPNSLLLIQAWPRNDKVTKDTKTPCNKWVKNSVKSEEGVQWKNNSEEKADSRKRSEKLECKVWEEPKKEKKAQWKESNWEEENNEESEETDRKREWLKKE